MDPQVCLSHVSECVISCPSSRITSRRNPVYYVVRKKNVLCFCRQNSHRHTEVEQHSVAAVSLMFAHACQKWSAGWKPANWDCVNSLLSSIFRRSLFCWRSRKRDAPSGSFQSSTSASVASAVKKKKKKIFSFIVHQILTVYQLHARQSLFSKSLRRVIPRWDPFSDHNSSLWPLRLLA